MSAPRVVQVYINEYRPAEGGVEWIVEIGVDPNEGSIEGEREFDAVGAAAEWAVKWCRDRGYNSELLIGFSAHRPAEPPIEPAEKVVDLMEALEQSVKQATTALLHPTISPQPRSRQER